MCKFIIAQKGENVKKTEVKTIETYYCDFCGYECTDGHHDVVLPFAQPNKYTSRFTPDNPDDITIKQLCLCNKCAKKNGLINTFLSNAGHNRVDLEQAETRPYEGSYITMVGTLRYQVSRFSTRHEMVLKYKE